MPQAHPGRQETMPRVMTAKRSREAQVLAHQAMAKEAEVRVLRAVETKPTPMALDPDPKADSAPPEPPQRMAQHKRPVPTRFMTRITSPVKTHIWARTMV